MPPINKHRESCYVNQSCSISKRSPLATGRIPQDSQLAGCHCLAAPQAAQLCAQGAPSTDSHSTLCRGANTRALTARVASPRYTVQVQPSRAEDAPQPGTPSFIPPASAPSPLPAPQQCLQQSCSALRVCTQHKEQCTHPLELLPNHCRKK